MDFVMAVPFLHVKRMAGPWVPLRRENPVTEFSYIDGDLNGALHPILVPFTARWPRFPEMNHLDPLIWPASMFTITVPVGWPSRTPLMANSASIW